MSPNPLTRGLRPTHPGEILREEIFPALKKSKVEIAELLGISRRALYNILDGKVPITPLTAVRIAKLIGSTPEFLLTLQAAYDIRQAEAEIGAAAIEAIPTLEAAE